MPWVKSLVRFLMWQKIFSLKKKTPRWEVLSSFPNSMRIIILWVFLKTSNPTKDLPKCKSPESAAKWSHKRTKNKPISPITKKANAHSRTNKNHNLTPFSSNWKKKRNFSNSESTLTCTSLESMVFWKMMSLSCLKKNGMNLWLMSPFWKLGKAHNFKSISFLNILG